MFTCKDCVHYEVCEIWCGEANIPMSTDCDFFKNKADFVEVKHGKWEKAFGNNSKTRTCSNCHISQTVNVFKDKVMFNYCPYCGADMRKGGAE